MAENDLEALTEPFLASDLAREVVNLYDERRQFNVGVGHSTQAVLEAFRDLLTDPDEGPVIFLALAARQLREGAVLTPIRDAAVSLIDTGDAQRAWRQLDSLLNRQRKEALVLLRERLLIAMLAE